jgi:hypothetical protein
MLTIFAMPKAFRGQFKIIQANAIRSWTLLRPTPEVLLFGDDEGTTEIARELGLLHMPDVERNEYGTPLVNDIFQKGQTLASNNLVCYVNADIILMSDFMEAVKKVIHLLGGDTFLIIGRKSNVEIDWLLDFKQSDWEYKLKNLVKANGKYVTYDSDFFVFPKGMFKGIPPFAIGRCFWTQWLVYNAWKKGGPVIDVTPIVTSVESKHDYSHATSTGGAKRLSGVEYVCNRNLFKGCKYFTTIDATHILTDSGLKKSPFKNRIVSFLVRLEYYVYFLLKGTLYPYSLPLIILFRWTKSFLQAVSRIGKYVYKLIS